MLRRVEIYFFIGLHVLLVLLKDELDVIIWEGSLSSLAGGTALMAFLLVFYNGQCYSRFIGFYEACTGMMGASQELVELIAVHLAEQPVAKWDAVRYLIASVLLTYYSAMGTMDRGWEELQRPKSIGEGGGELVCPPLLTAHEASLLQQFGNAFVPLHAWTVHALHVGFAQEARLRPSPATGSAALSEAADCVLRVRRAIAYIKNTLAMPIPFIYFHTLNLIMYSMYTIFAFAFTSLKVRLRPDDVLARDIDSAVPCLR